MTADLTKDWLRRGSDQSQFFQDYSLQDTISAAKTLLGKEFEAPQSGSSVMDAMVTQILDDPCACGYFLAYASRTFCAENIKFYIAVQLYKDDWKMSMAQGKLMRASSLSRRQGLGVWNLTVSSKESPMGDKGMVMDDATDDESENRSSASSMDLSHATVDATFVSSRAVEIYQTFCTEDAPTQISLGHSESEEIRTAMEQVTRGNKPPIDLFDPAISLVMKSIKMDVFPRFKNSPEVLRYLSMVHTFIDDDLYHGGKIVGGSIPSNISKYALEDTAGVIGEAGPDISAKGLPTPPAMDVKTSKSLRGEKLCLSVVVENRFLWMHFCKYLEGRFSSETLHCWQCCKIFRKNFAQISALGTAGRDRLLLWAWRIFTTYLIPGQPKELPSTLLIGARKLIAYRLSNPVAEMFSEVERSAWKMLKYELFPEFRMSEEGCDERIMQVLQEGSDTKTCCIVT
eukprot:g795.t1